VRVWPSFVLIASIAACGRPLVGGSEGGTASETVSVGTSTSATGVETSDSVDESDGSEPPYCGGFSIVPSYVPPNILFVVDVSSSMLETWDDDQDPMTAEVSRWLTARSSLEQVVVALGDQFHVPRLGMQRAPSSDACLGATADASNCTDADVCLVETTPEVAVGDAHGELILAALPEASASLPEVVGGSPLGQAYLSARDHLLAQPDEGYPAIVLFTDGGAHCSEPSLPAAVEVFDDGLASLVDDVFAVHGIPTFVVGVDVDEQQPSLPAQPDSPAIDTYAALNALALAGGAAWNGGSEPRKFFDVREPDELLDMLTNGLISEVTDCTVDLTMVPDGPPEPEQIPLIVIEANGEDVPFVLDCENEHGWTWIEEGTILTFCGSFCEAFKTGAASFEGIYGCPPI
jgi:hypothetical protein